MESNSVSRQGASERGRGLRALRSGRTASKETAKPTKKYSFLTHKIEPIPSFSHTGDSQSITTRMHEGRLKLELGTSILIDAEMNIKHLENVAYRYARLCDKPLGYQTKGNPMVDISALYDAVQRIAPVTHTIAVDYDTNLNELVFVEYAPVDYEEYTIFALPIGFADTLPEHQREICCRFLHHLIYREGFAFPDDHWDMSYALGLWDDEVFTDTPDSYREMVERYLHGDIHDLMWEIVTSTGVSDDDLRGLQNLQRITKGHLSEIFGLTVEYLKTLNDKSCLSYYRTPNSSELGFYDNEQSDYLTPDRLNFVVYGCGEDDAVADMAITMCCEDASNVGQQDMYQRRILSELTERMMPHEDYPKRWATWFGKFVTAIMDYEQDYRNNKLQIRAENGCDCIPMQSVERAVS